MYFPCGAKNSSCCEIIRLVALTAQGHKSSLNLYLQFSLALLTPRVNTKDNLPTFNVSWKFCTTSAGCSKQVHQWTDSSKYCILLRNYFLLLSYSTVSCRIVTYNLGVPSFPTSASEREDYFLTNEVSWTIIEPIKLTIIRFPGLFHFNPTHKLSRNSMKKPQRKTRAHNIFTTRPVLAYSARTCSLPYLVALALIW